MRTAVVGHVEWVQVVRVARVPRPGEIARSEQWWEGPAGGGAAAAMQLYKLSGSTMFFTATGDDLYAHRFLDEFAAAGVRVHRALRPQSTRRAFTHVDNQGERTITVIGSRLEPRRDDLLPWHELESADAVYFTAGDVAALQAARRARVLVATARVLPVLAKAGVALDALVASDSDEAERYEPGMLDVPPRLFALTRGDRGGTFWSGGSEQTWPAAPLPGPIQDRYGAGDSFAACLTFALSAGLVDADAIGFAARGAASVLTGRGPYAGQLDAAAVGFRHP